MDKITNTLYLDEQTFLSICAADTSLALEVAGATRPCEVKQKLMSLYGDIEVEADGKPVKISALGDFSTVRVNALEPFDKLRYNVIDAMRVIDRLIRPGDGCPWDSVQTHDSIRINMIEEAYEAVDAIDKRDVPNMREEFGDVLLQSLLQSAIARKNGEFDFADVCDELCKKLISRHTWLFGGDTAEDADKALDYWEKNKAVEKHYTSLKDKLERLPDTFSALLLCEKVYKKLKKAGQAEDARKALGSALEKNDRIAAIYALTALAADEGLDAEAELNKLVKQKIADCD